MPGGTEKNEGRSQDDDYGQHSIHMQIEYAAQSETENYLSSFQVRQLVGNRVRSRHATFLMRQSLRCPRGDCNFPVQFSCAHVEPLSLVLVSNQFSKLGWKSLLPGGQPGQRGIHPTSAQCLDQLHARHEALTCELGGLALGGQRSAFAFHNFEITYKAGTIAGV